MHSSRMRTARTLTVSRSTLCSGGYLVWRGSAPGVVPGRGGGAPALRGVPGPRGVPSPGGVCSGGIPGPGGYLVPVVCLLWGVYLAPGGGAPGPGGRGCTWSGTPPTPPLARMTHTSENIILPETSFAGGNKY